MKRAILTITALIVAIAMIFPVSSISASAATVPVITLEEANAAANWARSQVGSNRVPHALPPVCARLLLLRCRLQLLVRRRQRTYIGRSLDGVQ